MTVADIPALQALAAVVHPDFPETEAVFAERLHLFPRGCRVLVDPNERPQGYLLSHPWRRESPVPLDSILGTLPLHPETLYIHDLAVLPGARGSGVAGEAVEAAIETAGQMGLAEVSLVAVNNSALFWARHGFFAPHSSAFEQLQSYGTGAIFMVRVLKAPPRDAHRTNG